MKSKMQLEKLEIKSIKKLPSKQIVNDIQVQDAEHYILKDGTISHNSGLDYASSFIIRLTKAKLDKGVIDDFDMGKSGHVVSCYMEKSRLTRPKKGYFWIEFDKGSNSYIGLDFFCTKETFNQVGIFKGKYNVDKTTGEETLSEGGNFWYVHHLKKSVTTNDLFTPEVFTQEVLEKIDPLAKAYFSYGNAVDKTIAEFKTLKSTIVSEEEIQAAPTNLAGLE